MPSTSAAPPGCGRPCPVSIGGLALGRDGNVWFEDNNRKVIGRITRTGDVKQFSEPYELDGGANTIAAGPDGNVWLTASGGGGGNPDWILRITPTGVITKFSAGERPAGEGQFGSGPESITAGPDGAMWFTEFWTNRIGRLTTSGTLTEFPIPQPDSAPRGIVTGPDGNIWFVESTRARPAIARLDRDGLITEFPLSSGPAEIYPHAIVAGPDGNLWFTQTNGIAHITVNGDIVPVSLPSGSAPGSLVTGPDGNMWYGDVQRNVLVRMGVTGARREFPLPHRGAVPYPLVVGADGRVWFGETNFPVVASIGVKVPEVLVDRRPVVFADASTSTVSIRNTGDAPLTIGRVRITGVDAALFSTSRDGCSGATIAPDSSCGIVVQHSVAGPSAVQSAVLEIVDNATGSPQRLQLVAQPPQCHLPVVEGGDNLNPGSGEQLDVRAAQVLYDPSGALSGKTPGYYDRVAGGWLPVEASSVSPDGRRYVYFPPVQGQSTQIRVVDVLSGTEKPLSLPANFWGVVAFTADGVYLHIAYEGYGPGVMLLNPDTGVLKPVFTDTTFDAIDGSTGWVTVWNSADKLPNPSAMGGGSDEVLKRDMVTGKTTTWLYRPGTNVHVVALWAGAPIVSVYDGASTTFWLVTAAGQAQKLEFPFETAANPTEDSFVGDEHGLWVGSADGVYLWTPRTGSVLVTDTPARPAGTCA
jgi:streptogramin lyase